MGLASSARNRLVVRLWCPRHQMKVNLRLNKVDGEGSADAAGIGRAHACAVNKWV